LISIDSRSGGRTFACQMRLHVHGMPFGIGLGPLAGPSSRLLGVLQTVASASFLIPIKVLRSPFLVTPSYTLNIPSRRVRATTTTNRCPPISLMGI
jgi:hypothetical protein